MKDVETLFKEWEELPVDQMLRPKEYIKWLESKEDCTDDFIKAAFFAGYKSRDVEIKQAAVFLVELKRQNELLRDCVEFYANGMNYSLDDYCGISGEMRSRVVLYGDSTEINDVASHAGRRARETLEKLK